MSDGHCFISYSNRDAENFGPQLSLELEGEHPYFQTWCDKNNIPPGQKWDHVISKAIGDCKCFLFVVTQDSVAVDSICMRELSLALSYKKPIFPLYLEKEVELPWRIRDFQKIDFYEDHRRGMVQLRLAIQRVDSPEGQLDALRDRLSAAERDFNNAKSEEEKIRAQIDVDDLKKQIQVLKTVVDNPQAAQDQTKKNIETGLERERQPEKPVASKTSTKFINPPPGIAPNYFQDRTAETGEIVRFLHDDSQRMFTVVGRGGVGKTAMICRLLKHLESGTLPEDIVKTFKETKVDGIVYLSESGSHRVNFANIFYDLCKLLPAETANELDTIYKNPQGSTESKMHALLEKFTDGRVVLLLDNFEPLVDSETFAIRDAELDEALRAFLNGTHTAVNIVITTRVAPQTLNRKVQPGRQRILDLDDGLEQKYAKKMLQEMDADGKLGLKKAKANLLNLAHKRTLGYPRALEALFAILASDRYTSLEEILTTAENYLPDEVVEALVGEAFNRLDTNAQKVMQALAIYNRPVTPAAVDFVLAPHIPAIDGAPILQRLANMHFARKESGRFYLHPVDREFAFGLLAKGDAISVEQPKKSYSFFKPKRNERDDFTQVGLTDRAASYYAQARKPRAEWKKLDDLSAQLAEFDLRCAAGDYDTAASVLVEIDFDYLFLWGHYRLMIELNERLQKENVNSKLKMINLSRLGSANAYIGKISNAIFYQEQALSIARAKDDKRNEGELLCNLGNRYSQLGNMKKAIEHYEQSSVIYSEIGHPQGKGGNLVNIGICYMVLGNTHKAIEIYEQALVIAHEFGDSLLEGACLGNLGNCYNELGDYREAIDFQEKSLIISRNMGDRRGESVNFENIGHAFLNLEEYQKADENYHQAIHTADEISFPNVQQNAHLGFAKIHLFQNDLLNARTTIEAALQYDMPENNHNVSALLGIIALRQGERESAQEAFTKSIAQADEILAKTPEYYEALDARGLSICGLVLCRGAVSAPNDDGANTGRGDPAPTMDDAIETFRKARKIAPHAGVVKKNLRLFDELVKCEGGEILKDVRNAVEGVE